MGTGLVWLEGGHWGFTTAVYLFFASLAGGAHVAGVAARVVGDGPERGVRLAYARWAFLVALGAASVAGIAILSHLADPLAGLLFPVTLTNVGSWITVGTWVLVLLGVFSALQTLWLQFGALGRAEPASSSILRRPVGRIDRLESVDGLADWSHPGGSLYWVVTGVGLVPAVGTVYTGFELAAVATVPLWHEPALLPALFLASGVAAGVAAALVPTVAFEGSTSRTVVGFATVVGVSLLLSAVLLWELWGGLGGSPAAAESKALLTAGSLQTAVAVLEGTIVVSLVGSPLLAWIGYVRGEAPLTRRVVRPGLVATLLAGVVGTFLVRYLVLFAAVKEPVVVVGI